MSDLSNSAGFDVRIAPTAEGAAALALAELEAQLRAEPSGLISFATGRTYVPFFAGLTRLLEREPGLALAIRGTHLDEFVGAAPETPAGMAHELFAACEPLARAWKEGRFLAVPGTDAPAELQAHAERLEAAGGVALQLLGLGRNGHVAFNEPGTPWRFGFHVAQLTATTRADLAARFSPGAVPERAVTAGPATILAARRVVLVATGAAKAPVVANLLSGTASPALPASCLHHHRKVLLIVDAAAASVVRP